MEMSQEGRNGIEGPNVVKQELEAVIARIYHKASVETRKTKEKETQ